MAQPSVNRDSATAVLSEDRYLFPVNPGISNALAGTMGELRNTHFHSGIDIRTDNRIGLPILAAQRGYISRIAKSAFSYGNVIFVTHPDGNTTLYAHLHEFKGELARYVRNEQYRRKTFEIDLHFSPEQFPVRRGDTLALSGNTGSSNGPHLHFDVRDKNFDALNPLKYGFDEISDHLTPVVQKIALRTMDINARINNRFGRFEFYAYKSGGKYTIPGNITASGSIALEILAYDRMDRSPFQCGINYINVQAGGQPIFSQTIERVNIASTRTILALMDYKTMEVRGHHFNKLFIDDGNHLHFYEGTKNRGIIQVSNTEIPVHINLRDLQGNTSIVEFTLKPETSPLSKTSDIARLPLQVDQLENTLILESANCTDNALATVWEGGKSSPLKVAYEGLNKQVYLVDLRKQLPDSVVTCQGTTRLNFKDRIPSGTLYKYYGDNITIDFTNRSLFDTLFLSTDYTVRNDKEYFRIGDPTIPLQSEIEVFLRPRKNYTDSKYAVYRVERNHYAYVGGNWINGKIYFNTRELGEYTILPDTLAPGIRRLALNHRMARFIISDDRSGISYFEANLNGEWLLMNYDYKSGVLYAETMNPGQPLKGDFELKVVDRAGNERIYKQKIL